MPNSVKCESCKGEGYYVALVSQHNDATEIVKMSKLSRKGCYLSNDQ